MMPIEPGSYLASAISCSADDHHATAACAYQVHWTINPHMKPGSVNADLASAQHTTLIATMRRLGARVEVLPFVCGAFDSVFIKDNAILRHDGRARALLGGPVHAVRDAEQAARAIALRSLGFEVVEAENALEGGDVVQMNDVTLLGCGPRSSPRAVKCLERFLGHEVVALPLRNPHLYHLDTAMTVLCDGTALLCREAFENAALAEIDRLLARGVLRAAYEIPYLEALSFAANVVEVSNAIITGTRAQQTSAILRGIGCRVVEVPLDQFHLAGGSAACLLARVMPPRSMQIPTTAMRSAAA